MPFIVTAVTAIVGAISDVLAAGGIGAALIRLGGTLLLSYASQALMPKPKTTLQARTVTVREPVVPRDMVYGRTPARAVSLCFCMPLVPRISFCIW